MAGGPLACPSRNHFTADSEVVGVALVMLAVVALGVLTFHRNRDYRSDVSIWEDTVGKAPRNARAHADLGLALHNCNRLDEAIVHYRTALAIAPDFAEAHYDIARSLFLKNQADEAIVHYRRAVGSNPTLRRPITTWAWLCRPRGQLDEAIEQFRMAVASKDDMGRLTTISALLSRRKGCSMSRLPSFARRWNSGPTLRQLASVWR